MKRTLIILAVLFIPAFLMYSQPQDQHIIPPFLQKGDTIGVVSISFKMSGRPSRLDSVINAMSDWGLCIKKGEYVYDSIGAPFPAGDRERAADLQNMLDNENVKAVIFMRGGYGAVRIIDFLDMSNFREHPKWLVGFSDLTVIHSLLFNIDVESIHGPNAACLEINMPFDTVGEYLRQALFGELKGYNVPYNEHNICGEATAKLVGGNLNLLASGVGTDNDIDTRDCILVIEDTSEPMYHIDSYLQQLKRSGKFDHLKGLIIGDFDTISDQGRWHRTMDELLKEYIDQIGVPTIYGFPFGHKYLNYPMYLGHTVKMNVTPNDSSIEFIDK